jgi:hypothetical protein
MTSLPVTLPTGFVSSVTTGDTVKTGDILAAKSSRSEVSVNIAEALEVNAHTAGKFLKKNPGDAIVVGETIALKKGILGLNESRVESQVNGTIIKYERNTGNLSIQLQGEATSDDATQQILCPIDGTIALCDNGRIVIETDKNVSVGIAGVGGTCQAMLTVLADNGAKQSVASHELTPETIGTIILGRSFDKEILLKAVGIGIAGIIAERIEKSDLEYMAKKKLLLPVITVDNDTYKELQKLHGKTIYMDANTATILLLKI